MAALGLFAFHGTAAADGGDTVLISNSVAKVTKADYEAQLDKIPADLRGGFGNDPRRVNELLTNLLVQKSMAARARAAHLDAQPDVAARIALETELILSRAEAEAVQAAAGKEFDADIAKYERRAREIYLVDKERSLIPAQISATHILFTTKDRSNPEARKLAEETRAKIAAGADMGELAKQLSEDPTAQQNGGALGWFSEKDMDPAFAAAAFALQKQGDLSQPVKSQYGWHIIRLDGKRPAGKKSYEEVHDAIIADLRKGYVQQKLDETLTAIRKDPAMQVNREAVGALTPKIDREMIRRAQEAVTAPGK